jgi:hypothetical protein
VSASRNRDQGASLARLYAAYQELAAKVSTEPDPYAAFQRASELREVVDRMVGEAAVLRAKAADRVRVADHLSLGQLAERLGLSKARADQLVRVAREVGE